MKEGEEKDAALLCDGNTGHCCSGCGSVVINSRLNAGITSTLDSSTGWGA